MRWAMCDCLNGPVKIKEGIKQLSDSIFNFLYSPNMERLSCISFCSGRLIGSMVGEPYVRVLGDNLYIQILKENMMADGCAYHRKCFKE